MDLRLKSVFLVSVALLLIGSRSFLRAADASAVGGGMVDGPPALTPQLGFGATSAGGSFQCGIAGRSGGFAFGPWSQVLQMEVHGDATPGSLSINLEGSAVFEAKPSCK